MVSAWVHDFLSWISKLAPIPSDSVESLEGEEEGLYVVETMIGVSSPATILEKGYLSPTTPGTIPLLGFILISHNLTIVWISFLLLATSLTFVSFSD